MWIVMKTWPHSSNSKDKFEIWKEEVHHHQSQANLDESFFASTHIYVCYICFDPNSLCFLLNNGVGFIVWCSSTSDHIVIALFDASLSAMHYLHVRYKAVEDKVMSYDFIYPPFSVDTWVILCNFSSCQQSHKFCKDFGSIEQVGWSSISRSTFML